MLLYINTSEHGFRKWLDSFFQNTPLAPLLPPNSRLILGAPQPSMSLFREPEIIIPAKRLNEQSENDLVNVSEQTRWILEKITSKNEYFEIGKVLSISIKPIGLGQRTLVSVTSHDKEVSQIAQTLIYQINQQWTDIIFQAENSPPYFKRTIHFITVESMDDFKFHLTRFVRDFLPYQDFQEILCDPWDVGKAIMQYARWNVFLPDLVGVPHYTSLTIDNKPYQHEHSRAWVLAVKLAKESSNAMCDFDMNIGIIKTGSPDKLYWMIWQYPETFSAEGGSVLRSFLQIYERPWRIEKAEPDPEISSLDSDAGVINGSSDMALTPSGSDTLGSGNTTIQIAPPTTDKEGKRKPGKPRNKDHEWAREQVHKLGRPPNEVYPEWVERIGNDRALALSDDRDLFRKLLKTKPKGS